MSQPTTTPLPFLIVVTGRPGGRDEWWLKPAILTQVVGVEAGARAATSSSDYDPPHLDVPILSVETPKEYQPALEAIAAFRVRARGGGRAGISLRRAGG